MRWSPRPHVFRSRNVLLADGIRAASVHVHQGRIQRIGPYEDSGAPGLDVLDVNELLLMPGLVDTHVHVNEPGRADWEGFATATTAAAAGGVTTVLDMPLNSVPATTNPRALEKKRRAAEGKCRVDVGFLGGVVPGNGAHLEPLWKDGVFAFKCFLVPSGVDEFKNVARADLEKAMPVLARLGATLMAHSELPGPIEATLATLQELDPRHYATYQASRPPEAETSAIAMMIELARAHGTSVHIVHVSAAESVSLLRDARSSRVAITAETCPHYLSVSANQVPDGATEFKCAPPIRGMDNQSMLWEALEQGVIDMIVSDHSPCPPALKRRDTGDFFAAWGGIASLELGLAVIATDMRHRGFHPARMGQWLASSPARLAGLEDRKGAIVPGADADFAVVDSFSSWTVDASSLHQRHKITPYHGRTLTARARATYLRGALIFADGQPVGEPTGVLLSRSA